MVGCLVACGRAGFPPFEDVDGPSADGVPGAVDGPITDGAPRCSPETPFTPLEPLLQLDTPYYDAITDLSDDELTLYLSSDRGRPGMGAELYYTTRADKRDPWTTPLTPFYPTIHPPWDDYAVAIAPDRRSGVVASNRGGTEHLWIITRSDVGFVDDSIPATILTSTGSEGTPKFSRDGRTIYFDSSRPTTGNRDLYQAPVLAGTFGTPQRIGGLATAGLEAGPTLTADERTIYFLSSSDIFMATRAEVSLPFGPPTPVTAFNTADFDAPGVLSRDGCTLYVNRNVPGESWNVFVATRAPP